ncbi:MAG TPA: TA system VapC family ribonuclease toxin [Acidimicrobiia bacterium]
MRCVDVDVLVCANRADMPEHSVYRANLEEYANDSEPLGLADVVLAGFLRVITNRRIFTEPTTPAEAWGMIGELLSAPAAVFLRPGERHWNVFERLRVPSGLVAMTSAMPTWRRTPSRTTPPGSAPTVALPVSPTFAGAILLRLDAGATYLVEGGSAPLT